jgi:hypothetical protein
VGGVGEYVTDTDGNCHFQSQANTVCLQLVNVRNVFSRNHVFYNIGGKIFP